MRIATSFQNPPAMMYSLSSRTCSWNGISLLPLICQRQVMPGITSSRLRSSSVYCATSEGTGGRGPTRLMSPMNTFQSCGSSSRLVRRRNRPTLVMRGSSFILKITPSFDSFCAISAALHASASVRMLRNFQKRKWRP